MKNPRAFSLIEIVLALGLASFSMLAIFALVAQGQKIGRESRLESVSALLAGKVISQLRASAAWETNIAEYTGPKTLSDIASGTTASATTYFDMNLTPLGGAFNPDRQFAMTTTVGPISTAGLVSQDANVTSALTRLGGAANTVFATIEVSYPAQAPYANRSKRRFSAIITRTSDN